MSNKNMEFKDSGIPWIGQIPKHWEVIRNKYILSGLYSGGTPTSGIVKLTPSATGEASWANYILVIVE